MISYADYAKRDAQGLAELVRTKQVSAQELLETALARSKAVNPKINAIVIDHEDVARKQIKEGLPNGPFTGVPFLLKDLGASLKGTVTTGGMRLMREAVADHDTTYVERIKAAGFTILAGFLGWYALAVWNHNGAPVGGWQIWESAHAYLWRCAALFILLHAIQTAMVLSRPAVPLPADQPRPQRQVIEE